jgi:hypothetical protein
MQITKTLGRAYALGFALMGAFILTLALVVPGQAAVNHRPHPHPTVSRSAPSAPPTVSPSAPAPVPTTTTDGTFSGPAAPAGWKITYQRNFASTPGLGDWVVQPGAGATVLDSTKPGAEFGAGVEMTQLNQWAELISSDAVVGPNSFVQGLIFIPSAAGSRPAPDAATFPAGTTANWPAFWTFGNPWPQNGEIDALEAQSGQSCEQTHYSSGPTSSTEINSPSNCSQGYGTGTGWTTVSILRQNEVIKVWYGTKYIGQVPLPTTADEKLVFQNQSYSTSVCGHCFGPTVLGSASTAWLSNVRVYAP